MKVKTSSRPVRHCDCGSVASDKRVDNALVCERCYRLDIGRRDAEKRRRAVAFAGDSNDYYAFRGALDW